MTVREAITTADALAPNAVAEEIKVRWLSELDGRAVCEIHAPDKAASFSGYTVDTSKETVLQIPYPYDSIYPIWLNMQINRLNGEMQKYNDGAALCEETLNAYRRYLERSAPPLPPCTIRYY